MEDEHRLHLEKIKESLLEQDRLEQVSAILEDMRESEIAEVLEILDNEQRRRVFDILEIETAAEVLERVNEATRSDLFEVLTKTELRNIIIELDPEDAADILAEMEEQLSNEIIYKLPPHKSAQVKKILQYSEDSAGGIMDLDVISVYEQETVAQAVNKVRSSHRDEDFYSVFVVDKDGKFLGDVRIRYLITAEENAKVKKFLDTDTIFVKTDTDQQEVQNIFNKNNLIVVPVLDEQDRLVGRITADRVIEVAQEEAAEDLYAMAGTEADELEDTSILRAARIRMTWLLPCLFGTAITALVVLFFKNFFHDKNVFYVYTTAIAFMPMIAAISGNAGLQTSAIVVSGLAGGHLIGLDLTKVFAREIRVALWVALFCGVIGGLICCIVPYLITSTDFISSEVSLIRISGAFTIAMFSAIMVATTLGLFLPFLFRKIGIDPAISSGPLVTTANDSISVAIYLALTFFLSSL